ncbi:MAG TPA: hypothetical protein VGJ90_04155 [Methylophilaceae bacterium]|jgi:hypothetical protein
MSSNNIRLLIASIHAIIFLFALFVFFSLTDFRVYEAIKASHSDSLLKNALLLSALVLCANLIGLVLPLTKLCKKIFGCYLLLGFECAVLVLFLKFTSLDYSILIAITTLLTFYLIAITKKEENS